MTSDPKTAKCEVCRREPERGWIEMENNGPIVPCWGCNHALWRAEMKRECQAT
jgi:hypothetical protein